MKATINLNDQFTVILTASGAKMRNDYYAWMRDFYPDVAPKLSNAGDALTEPLWELMRIFGPHISAGMPEVPFMKNSMAGAAPAHPGEGKENS